MQKKIKKMIDSAEIVSFDVFDTLIHRVVLNPKDVFHIVQDIFNENNVDKIKNFFKIRCNSEINIRNKVNREITISEIYNEIKNQLNIEENKIEELKKIELDIENEICFVNKKIEEIIKYCNEINKRVIITSDMYLNTEFIKKLIVRTKLNFEKIYVSSDIGLKKSNGRLFEYIVQDLKIKPEKLLHIGDNFKSDYIQPKRIGIKSYWFKKRKNDQKVDYKTYLLKEYTNKIYENNSVKDKYFEFGYKKLGPLMYGFLNYLNNSISEGTDKILFLAREGKFMKECYDLFKEDENISTDYLYVSRKSISSSIIYNHENLDEIIELQSLALNETVEMFLKRFNLLNEKNIKLLEKEHINLKSNFYITKDKIKQLFNNLMESSLQKKDIFKEYLRQFNINNQTVLVDIGWNGTMQDLIHKEMDDKEINMHGYYIGVRKKRKNKYKHGYLFDGDNEGMEIASRSMVALLEILFSANHGTTSGYILKNEILPIIEDNEIEEGQLQKIIQIQEGAKKFIKDYRRSYFKDFCKFDKNVYSNELINLGINPTNEDIKLFDEFMVFNEKSKKLIGGKTLAYYIMHLNTFKSDFFDSGWKIAFLKKVFKIKLPYKKIYEIIYKLKK